MIVHVREPQTLSRRRMFDALPLHVQASLPTWPLPTYADVKLVYDRWIAEQYD